MSDTKRKPTRGQQMAENMVRIEKHDALGGIELQIGRDVICWEVEGAGKLPRDAESIKRYFAYKIDTAYQEGRRAGEKAERELSVRGKKTTLEEVKKLKKDRKAFETFVRSVGEFLKLLDAEMRTPSTVERGRRIAHLCNKLEFAKDRAAHFHLLMDSLAARESGEGKS